MGTLVSGLCSRVCACAATLNVDRSDKRAAPRANATVIVLMPWPPCDTQPFGAPFAPPYEHIGHQRHLIRNRLLLAAHQDCAIARRPTLRLVIVPGVAVVSNCLTRTTARNNGPKHFSGHLEFCSGISAHETPVHPAREERELIAMRIGRVRAWREAATPAPQCRF